MNQIQIQRHSIKLFPNNKRVIVRPFIPGDIENVTAIIGRILALTEAEVVVQLAAVHQDFSKRHYEIDSLLLANYRKIENQIEEAEPLSTARKLLLGAAFSGEYSLESAALFNPSIIPHPDQSDAPQGGLRFIMSLRATGEGHISSIEFCAGTIDASGDIQLDPTSRYVTTPEVIPNPTYQKSQFLLKLREMGLNGPFVEDTLNLLGEDFTFSDLTRSLNTLRRQPHEKSEHFDRTIECIQWLADSNYELRFSEKLAISERILFPVSLNEAKGIEDARFVRFTDEDGTVVYCATYTAYNGHSILPQLIRTEDFLDFRVLTLNGDGVQNKGMALFPRRINGRYAMLSRQDDENILIMFSDSPHHWSDPQVILRPEQPWEFVKIGNCGSPIETEAGWLIITHGVGAMREYCIGAALLDLDDPTKVIGRLREPLLSAAPEEREGYVPNVVYSCGSMLHGDTLILPYAISDHATVIASISLDSLLSALLSPQPTEIKTFQ